MRGSIKKGIELGLARTGLASSWRRMAGLDSVILAYHNVVPSTDGPLGDSSLHLGHDRFVAQIELLAASHEIVSLEALLSGAGGRIPQAAITFDDAYRGAVRLAIGELVDRGIPSTLFVSPGLLGSDGFWWDRTADPGDWVVPDAFRQLALSELGGRHGLIMDRAGEMGLALRNLPDSYLPVSAGELDAWVGHPLVSIGSHTWSHVCLSSVPEAEAEEELRRSFEWLGDRVGPGPSFISYPYGAQNEGVRALAGDIGYSSAFLIEGGAFAGGDVSSSRFSIPRINIPRGLSLDGFTLRVMGARSR